MGKLNMTPAELAALHDRQTKDDVGNTPPAKSLSIKDLAALYIAQEMKWSNQATEYEKILVCGNLQGFAAYVDNYLNGETQ